MKNKSLTILLWVCQIVLGLFFLLIGTTKTFTPINELAETIPWVLEYPNLVRFIGISELLGGIGIILPAAIKVLPKLSGYAGLGLGVIMVLAIGFHAIRGEYEAILMNVIVGAAAFFVFWGRTKGAPIEKK